MFNQAQNVLLSGVINHAQGNIHINNSSNAEQAGFDAIYQNACPGAFHDSGERFDAPKCHANTRVAIIDEIIGWLDDPYSPTSMMWMHGPAGAGKSSIAQTLAEILKIRGQHSASFFFSRTSTTGRAHEKRLVATLAYQFAKYIPETRPHISSVPSSDPAIFDLSLRAQIQALLVNPLTLASATASEARPAMLIIIDGLDECSGSEVQRRILSEFSDAIKSMQHDIPQRLLIASRSEVHLLTAFNGADLATMSRRLALDSSYKPDADIRLFLNDSFAGLRNSHSLRSSIPAEWPIVSDIEKLIQKSSGQFIFSSVVVKYVCSPRHNPLERLRAILAIPSGHKDRPFAELDSLYAHIFSMCDNLDAVLTVLRLQLSRLFGSTRPYSQFFLKIFKSSKEEMELAFNDLVSVINLTETTIQFLHASLPDFLVDESRSKHLFVDQNKINVRISVLWAVELKDIRSLWWPVSSALSHLYHHASRLSLSEDRVEVLNSLSHVYFQPIFERIDREESLRESEILLHSISQLFSWVLQVVQSQDSREPDPVLSQLRQWTFQDFPYNGFDDPEGIDLTVFTLHQFYGDTTGLKPRLNLLGLMERWTIKSPPTRIKELEAATLSPFYQHVRYESSGRYRDFLLRLLEDPIQSDVHFLSGSRFAVGAIHCLRYILTKRSAESVRLWDPKRWLFERESFYLAFHYASTFLPKASCSKDLFQVCHIMLTQHSVVPQLLVTTPESPFDNAFFCLNTQVSVMFRLASQVQERNNFEPNPVFLPAFSIYDITSLEQWRTESVEALAKEVVSYTNKYEGHEDLIARNTWLSFPAIIKNKMEGLWNFN